MRLRFGLALSALLATLPSSSLAQVAPAPHAAQTAVALSPPLLPASFGDWKTVPNPANGPAQPGFLANVNKAALEESEPQRSLVQTYTQTGPEVLQVTAIEFKDASGALAAFSAFAQPGMHEVKDLATIAAAGDGGLVFVSGAAVAVAYPLTAANAGMLKALAEVMPKPTGSQALQPLLPTLVPSRGLVAGSVRYALGPEGYMAQGGVLPAAGLGWQQSAEAVTAKYNDKRGAETLTLLLYPTPTVAGVHLRGIDALTAGLGPSFKTVKTRREGSLLAIANGTFSADAAQGLVENAHLHQFLSTDKAMPTPEIVETRHTFGLLADIIVFSGLLGLSAILLGIFLGGGRALYRILRGKPAATEAEFLSLHLAPQNPAPRFPLNEPADPA